MAKCKSSVRKKPAQRIDRSGLPPIIIPTPPGVEKSSAVLLRFAEPLLRDIPDDFELFHNLVSLAVTAWNMSYLPPKDRDAKIDEYLKVFPVLGRLTLRLEFRSLIQRKKALFAEYHWPILEFHVREELDEFRVEVMSLL